MNTDQSNPFAWKFIWDDGEYFYSNKFETIESYAEGAWKKYGQDCGYIVPMWDQGLYDALIKLGWTPPNKNDEKPEQSQDQNEEIAVIDKNKTYTTREGSPVRIYATDGRGTYCIHGARHTRGGWKVAAWDKFGRLSTTTTTLKDLVEVKDWRDDIPWDYLHEDIVCVARDKDGEWYGYITDDLLRSEKSWKPPEGYNYQDSIFDLTAVKMPHGPDDWREAYAVRPEKK